MAAQELDPSHLKFGVGQSVPRQEDPVLIRGEGRYTDDVNADGQLYAHFVRSPYAHGIIRGIDTVAAAAMPGVAAIYTGHDLGQYGTLKCVFDLPGRNGTKMLMPKRPSLPTDKVRFVGDPVAIVIAKTKEQARDAAEAVVLDIETLPALTTVEVATAKGAPLLYEDAPRNIILDYHYGDSDKVAAAFAKAAHVVRLPIHNNRVVVNSLEPRAALASYDKKAKRFTLNAPSQGVFGKRNLLAEILGVPKEDVRLITGHVGGSFGMKGSIFPEYVPLLHAARELGKPVKWTDIRSDSFVSDHHGRDMDVLAELALDKRGRFLATRFTGTANIGAYLSQVAPLMTTLNIAKNSIGMYRTPLIEVNTILAVTNTVPVAAYRGAGRPEGNYFMERLIDVAATQMGLDRVELRRRNMVTPDDMPWTTPAATTYDSGDFPGLFARALEAADWKGFPARKRESAKRGKLRGRGIGCYLEVTAAPASEMGGLRFNDDGTVTIVTGTLDYGQGHWSAFAQILHQKLAIPFESIKLLQGDSDQLIAGGGTGGSKSIMASGAAILEAGDLVIEKGKQIASFVLEAGIADLEFKNGRFTIAGTDRSIGIMELAAKMRDGRLNLPPEIPRTLNVETVFKHAPSAYPNGCHIAEVEIDPQTGRVAVVTYVMVNDFGTVVNPLLVEGQLHGGVLQGIGQALMEDTVYDEEGQLVAGSFMDYALPRADNAPPVFTFESRPVPTKTNPLGAKGCGEAGCAGSLPSVMNAIVDALSIYGVHHIDMPATPLKIWQAIHNGQQVAAE